jgi:hypothetical protein
MEAMDKISRIVVSVPLALAIGALWVLPGCAIPGRDSSAKEWDRAQCNQIIDERERKRCIERVDSE